MKSHALFCMLFKDISYLQLWQTFCSVVWSHLSNFYRGHFEEHCEIIFNFEPVVQEMPFKDIS